MKRLAATFSWAFEARSDAPARGVPTSGNRTAVPPRGIDFAVIAILLLLSGYLWISRDSEPPAPADTTKSIAVLPFADLSDGRDNEYFSDGIAGEIMSRLTHLRGLRVAARTSSFAFKDSREDIRTIGEKLNVDAVLEGSVRKSGNQLRISAQLINVDDGFQLWSDTYDRTMDDILAIQDEIARAIIQALKVEFLGDGEARHGRHATDNIDAYTLYLRGRYELNLRTPESLSKAIELFEQAIVLDQNYALAYSGVADAYALQVSYGNLLLEQAQRKILPAIRRALEIDNQLAEAHASLGLLRSYQGDTEGAVEAHLRAIELNPNYPMAHMWLGVVYHEQNRILDAYREYQAALVLDPLHPVINSNIAGVLMDMGEFEQGRLRLVRALEFDPQSAGTLRSLSYWSGQYGRLAEAVEWARRAVATDPAGPLNRLALAEAYLWLGDFGNAERWILRAHDVGADNLSVFSSRANFYMLTENYPALDRYAQQQLADARAAGASPRSYSMRARLAWAGIAKVLLDDDARAVEYLLAALEPRADLNPAFEMIVRGYLAVAFQQMAEAEKAETAIVRTLEIAREAQQRGWNNPVMTVNLARINALRNDTDQALALLAQAKAKGWRRYWFINNNITFGNLRREEGFRQLMAEMKAEVDAMREQVRLAEANF